MPFLIQTNWMGLVHTAIDHSDEHRRRRESLGTELQRVPLTALQSGMSLDVLVPLLKVLGKLK